MKWTNRVSCCLIVGLAVAQLFFSSCSVNSDQDGDEQGDGTAPTVDQVCDLILDECGAAADGFTRAECNELGDAISINCMDCILEAGCDYEEQCHSAEDNCELK